MGVDRPSVDTEPQDLGRLHILALILLAGLPGYAQLGGMPPIADPVWDWLDLTFGLLMMGVFEELVFRGYLCTFLQRYTRSSLAIALWGPPFFEMSAREACREAANAALAIREYTKSLSHARELPELAGIDPPLGVATGLNYAPLFVGRFGPDKDYTGFSSGMNNTARLQGVAVRDEILCMERFAAILEGEAAFGEIRQAQVKNLAAPLAFKALEQIAPDGANAPAAHRR